MLAARAGARYVSPFVGRFDDIGDTGTDHLAEITACIKNYDWGYWADEGGVEVISASIRGPQHVVQAALMRLVGASNGFIRGPFVMEGTLEALIGALLAIVGLKVSMLYIGRFGFKTSATCDKFEGIETKRTALGDPYTPACAAAVVACDVVKSLDVGTHVIFVGELRDAEPLSSDEPMTYKYYHSVLRGKTPPKASSYVG